MRHTLLLFFVLLASTASSQSRDDSDAAGNRLLTDYFRSETETLTDQTFAGISTLDDWTSRRDEYKRQLMEMLGMDPMPEKTPLQPEITGTLEESGVIVERLHFQSMPGLYVTANLYRPKSQTQPLPAILYVCGHGGEKFDGVSLGNKTHYQHHGVWFAQNGYVCLTIDTVQLGEFDGIHHGTYREKMWWWNNRGYSSAGVEAFNCVRSLDYLQSREEVDGDRIGVTGRSGGGAYSWWIAAIDDRVTAAVPVAGITSLKNHVVDGCVEGHCDCMYMVNTYRWDFPMVAALVAPRPLLISNTDKDNIFPLDGVIDIYAKVRKIYALYDASDKIGLQISEGPHKDTQELRVAAFHWMNRFLRGNTDLIEITAKPLFEKRRLKVFEKLPADERVKTIHESFIPKVEAGDLDVDSQADVTEMINNLRSHCFRGWPETPEPLDVVVHKGTVDSMFNGYVIEFTSQSPFRLKMFLIRHSEEENAPLNVTILDDNGWNKMAPGLAVFFPKHSTGVEPNIQVAKEIESRSHLGNSIYIVPRGVGPTKWSDNERDQTHIRRRFMLLGQTLAGMQIYDIKRAFEAIREIPELAWSSFSVSGTGEAAFWTAYASLFDDGVDHVRLEDLPDSNRAAPDLLNVSRFVELADIKALVDKRNSD